MGISGGLPAPPADAGVHFKPMAQAAWAQRSEAVRTTKTELAYEELKTRIAEERIAKGRIIAIGEIAEMLDQECQSGHMKPITCGALCELSNNVVEKLASKYSNVEKEVTEVMGGKVLNYRSKEIYLEGCAFGREEGRKEGQKESIVQLVTRKYQLGDSPEKIAKDLLMSEEEVEEILGKTTGSQQ